MGLLLHKRCGYVLVIILIVVLIMYQTHNGPPDYTEQFITILAPSQDDVLQTSIGESDLVNLTDFKYKLKSKVCDTAEDILGVFIITSYVGHDELRSAHRQAMPSKQLAELGFVRVFLIADIPDHEKYITQQAIEEEHQRFDDLVQGNFVEAYRNLTYKHTMGIRWASIDCAKSKFIIKTDDDTVFDLFNLYTFLLGQVEYEAHLTDSLLAGYVLETKHPIRNQASKWYVSEAEYRGNKYPNYLSGWFYITNGRTVRRLLMQAQKLPFFWIDDTWVTGVLRESLDIPMVSLNSWFSGNSQFLDCCIEDVKRWSVKCDYYVGSNDGDTKLIIAFARAIEKCYNGIDECVERRPDQKLTMTCVGKSKNLVEEHGDAQVNRFKLK